MTMTMTITTSITITITTTITITITVSITTTVNISTTITISVTTKALQKALALPRSGSTICRDLLLPTTCAPALGFATVGFRV